MDLQRADPLCYWLYVEADSFQHPFFDETISASQSHPHNSYGVRTSTPLSTVLEAGSAATPIPPSSFIFHVSRCGSTLAGQLLGLDPANIILSEVPIFDQLLRWEFVRNGRPVETAPFVAALRLYSRKRREDQERVFIKTDSWHIYFYNELRALFPATPFIFLYRDPAEVIRSQQKRRGLQAVPGLIEPALLGVDPGTIFDLTLDEYMGKVLSGYFSEMIRIAGVDPLVTLINYNEGAAAMVQKIHDAVGIVPTAAQLEDIAARSKYHGKYPGELFGTEPELPAFPEWYTEVHDLYLQLDQVRMNR